MNGSNPEGFAGIGRYIGLDRGEVGVTLHKTQSHPLSAPSHEADIFQQMDKIYSERERRGRDPIRPEIKILSGEQMDEIITHTVNRKLAAERRLNRPKIENIGTVDDPDWAVVNQPKSSILYWGTFGSWRAAARCWVIEQRRLMISTKLVRDALANGRLELNKTENHLENLGVRPDYVLAIQMNKLLARK